jgi:hypothetical protein
LLLTAYDFFSDIDYVIMTSKVLTNSMLIVSEAIVYPDHRVVRCSSLRLAKIHPVKVQLALITISSSSLAS